MRTPFQNIQQVKCLCSSSCVITIAGLPQLNRAFLQILAIAQFACLAFGKSISKLYKFFLNLALKVSGMKKSVSLLQIKLFLKGLTGLIRQRQILTCGTCRCCLALQFYIPHERKGGGGYPTPLEPGLWLKKREGTRKRATQASELTPQGLVTGSPWELCNPSACLSFMSCASLLLKGISGREK